MGQAVFVSYFSTYIMIFSFINSKRLVYVPARACVCRLFLSIDYRLTNFALLKLNFLIFSPRYIRLLTGVLEWQQQQHLHINNNNLSDCHGPPRNYDEGSRRISYSRRRHSVCPRVVVPPTSGTPVQGGGLVMIAPNPKRDNHSHKVNNNSFLPKGEADKELPRTAKIDCVRSSAIKVENCCDEETTLGKAEQKSDVDSIVSKKSLFC